MPGSSHAAEAKGPRGGRAAAGAERGGPHVARERIVDGQEDACEEAAGSAAERGGAAARSPPRAVAAAVGDSEHEEHLGGARRDLGP